MPFKCPNCDTEHEKVPGYVSQEVLTQRLSAKSDEINALAGKVKELTTTAADAQAIRADRDRLAAEVEQVKAAAKIESVFAAEGIAADDALRASFRALYSSHVAGITEATERPAFEEWLASDDAKSHVLLAPHYGKATQPEQPTQPDPNGRVAAPRRAMPTVDANTTAVPNGAKPRLAAADIASVFASRAYKALPYEERKKLRTQWQEAMDAGTLTELPSIG